MKSVTVVLTACAEGLNPETEALRTAIEVALNDYISRGDFPLEYEAVIDPEITVSICLETT